MSERTCRASADLIALEERCGPACERSQSSRSLPEGGCIDGACPSHPWRRDDDASFDDGAVVAGTKVVVRMNSSSLPSTATSTVCPSGSNQPLKSEYQCLKRFARFDHLYLRGEANASSGGLRHGPVEREFSMVRSTMLIIRRIRAAMDFDPTRFEL